MDYESCFGVAVESRKRLNSESFQARDSEKGGSSEDLHLKCPASATEPGMYRVTTSSNARSRQAPRTVGATHRHAKLLSLH